MRVLSDLLNCTASALLRRHGLPFACSAAECLHPWSSRRRCAGRPGFHFGRRPISDRLWPIARKHCSTIVYATPTTPRRLLSGDSGRGSPPGQHSFPSPERNNGTEWITLWLNAVCVHVTGFLVFFGYVSDKNATQGRFCRENQKIRARASGCVRRAGALRRHVRTCRGG